MLNIIYARTSIKLAYRGKGNKFSLRECVPRLINKLFDVRKPSLVTTSKGTWWTDDLHFDRPGRGQMKEATRDEG